MVSELATPRHRRLWSAIEDAMAGGDLAHDALHVGRVYRSALRLAREVGVSEELAGAAALLHDLVAVDKEGPDRREASARSAAAAEEPLAAAGYSADERAEITAAIRTCSWSRGEPPSSALGAVLQDADRLDAIGALGIARSFATAGAMAARGAALRLYDPHDPLGRDRPLDDRRYALDHFGVKLLGLAAAMHTAPARREAADRLRVMEAFLEAFDREVSGPP